jgi:hypothetical protein
VVLPSFKQPAADRGKAVHINRPLNQFGDHSWTAIVNVAVERDGLVRRYPFDEKPDRESSFPRWARYWRGNIPQIARHF